MPSSIDQVIDGMFSSLGLFQDRQVRTKNAGPRYLLIQSRTLEILDSGNLADMKAVQENGIKRGIVNTHVVDKTIALKGSGK